MSTLRKWLAKAAIGLATATMLVAPTIAARTVACAVGQSIAVQDLPKQGRDTLALIADRKSVV